VIRLFFMEIDDHSDSRIMNVLLPLISVEKQQQISSMRFCMDRKLKVYADILLRSKACESLKLRNQDLRFSQNSFGKPYLLNDLSFHFNISHTRNALVVGLSEHPIGVDIEKMNPADPSVARKVFTDNEFNYVFGEERNQDRRFNEIWTKKESYVKWIGEGWSSDAAVTDVLCEPVCTQIITAEIKEYTISACSIHSNNDIHIVEVQEKDLLQIVGK